MLLMLMGVIRRYGRAAIFLAAIFSFSFASAQDYTAHNWYFGNSGTGIRFNRSDNVASLVSNQATPFGNGGSGVASDANNANLLFYTDGASVYDVNHQLMPNGAGLNANTAANQPVAICPVPGQPDQYYVFTNTANFTTGGTISYTIVDMSQFGNAAFPVPALGDVVNPKNTALGLANRSEGMVIIPHDNGMDYWLITQVNNTDNYTATLITTGGVFTNTTFNGLTGIPMVAANLSYHAASGRIAVSPQIVDRNVAILDFDNATGILSFNRFVLNSAVPTGANQAIFDTEWGPNGQFLYLSIHGDAGVQADVLQIDLNDSTATLTSALPQPNSIFRSYGLQMGPDSLIYHLFQASVAGPFLLGTLSKTDTVAAGVIYSPDAFGGGLDFNGTQFPSFSPKKDPNLSVSFTFAGTCSGTPTTFFPTVIPTADSLIWSFGDGGGSNQWSPVYSYQNGGAFPAKVIAFLKGDTASFSTIVPITQFDLQIQLVQDTAACRDEFPPPRGTAAPGSSFSVTATVQGGSPVSSVWSNGDTGLTLTPDSAGYYYLVVTDVSGCSAYAGVNVREYKLQDQRANIWYFGQNAGIDFNPLPNNPAVAISNPSMVAPEGCAIICDRNGDVIFYTDGDKVWDQNDAEVATGIGGDPQSSQSSLIIPVQNDETLYYIFTTQAVDNPASGYELRYSLFDLKLNGGTGGLVQQNIPLFARSTEHLTGNNQWLIAHEFGNNSFRAYSVTANGVSSPVITSIGSDLGLSPVESAQGYMKLGPQNRLAVALPKPGISNTVEIFDFDNNTGIVSNYRTVNLNTVAGNVYGIEFSPAGNKLFATISGPPSSINEFAFDSLGNPYFQQTVAQPGQLGAMQLGPDGSIYMAINNSNSLSTFFANEDTTQVSSLGALQPFPLVGGTQSRLGLPNFTQIISNIFQGPSIAAMGFCLGDSTSFSGTGTDPSIDEYQWAFGDGFGSTDQQVMHLYAAAGMYNVSLEITNRCGLDTTLFQTVTIVAPPAPPTMLPAGQMQAVLCNGGFTLEATPATNPDLPNLTFLWSTGETTRTVVITQQQIISVIITNQAGCTSNGSILVADNRPVVDLGPDQTICQNSAIAPLDAQNPGAVYSWTLNGASPSSGQTRSVDTSIPGTFTYQVQVTDPITTCTVTDQVTFIINESPAFNVVAVNTTGCMTATGQITVTITAPVSALFTYSVTGPSPPLSGIDQPAGPLPPFNGLLAGTYNITIVDQVTGCSTATTATISDNAFTASGAQVGTCNPLSIQVTTSAPLGNLHYTITNATTNTITTTDIATSTPFNTTPVINGDYIVEVRDDATGCVAVTSVITIQENPTVAVTFDSSQICSRIITAVASGATSFDWSTSPPGGISGATNMDAVTLNPGTWQLTVVVGDGGTNCPATVSINATVQNPVVDFIQSDPCSDQVTLTSTVTPPGAYTRRWYRNGVLLSGGSQIVAGLADNGVTYRVEAVSTATGCVFTSAPKSPINVAGNLVVSLTTTPPCDGSPFTITANSNLGGVTYQWSYNGNTIGSATSSTYQDTRAGKYSVSVSLSGCTKVATENIVLLPVTSGDLNNTYLICNNPGNPDPTTKQIDLNAGTDFQSYDWFLEGVSLGFTGQTYTATEPGNYSVDLINFFGCPSTDQTEVIEECDPRIKAPNAFRPGSSVVNTFDPTLGNSDFWILTLFIDDDAFQVFIYGRWGELVYQSNDRNFRWNGGYNNNPGQPLPPGTYTYKVVFKSAYRPEAGLQEQRGGVELLR